MKPTRPSFDCTLCEKTFPSQQLQYLHMKGFHRSTKINGRSLRTLSKTPILNCEQCPKRFTQPATLISHIKSAHPVAQEMGTGIGNGIVGTENGTFGIGNGMGSTENDPLNVTSRPKRSQRIGTGKSKTYTVAQI